MFQFTQPKRATTLADRDTQHTRVVSIHAAQTGCDLGSRCNSPHPRVSIHAAQAGCDSLVQLLCSVRGCFNSRSPSGLRRGVHKSKISKAIFQFTQPKRVRRLLQRYNKKEILSKDKSRKSLSAIILDEEDKAVGLELTDNQPLRNSNKIMFTWGSQPQIFV